MAQITDSSGVVRLAGVLTGVDVGVESLAVSGQPELLGDVVLAAGSGIGLAQVGQTVTVSNTGAQGVTEYAYTELSSNVTVSGTTPAAANSVIDGPSISLDGSTKVRIEFFVPYATTTSGSAEIYLHLWDGAVDLGAIGYLVTGTTVGAIPLLVARYLTPSAGSHSYEVRAYRTTANWTLRAGTAFGASTLPPGYLRVSNG